MGRDPGTVSRELARNSNARTGRYEPERAHRLAHERQRRPKPRKLAINARLNEVVQARLNVQDSPEQISGRLKVDFPDDPAMRISAETIYQAIYLHSVGQLRREIRSHLRTGRVARRTRAPARHAPTTAAASSTRSASTTAPTRSRADWCPAITRAT